MLRWLWTVLLVFLTAANASTSYGMSFERIEVTGGYVVGLTGEILDGDAARLGSFFTAQQGHLVGFGLNSPGGNLLEAERLSDGIHKLHSLVLVANNSYCASACFLLFASADQRLIQPGAAIGVHSASIGGKEDLNSLGMTTLFARDLAGYGVPADIIGQLVTTTADNMNWLTIEQLQEMRVKFTTPQPSAPPDPTPAQTFVAAPAPAPASASSTVATQTPAAASSAAVANVPSQTPAAFVDGMNDRRAWEAWVAGLTPSGRSGADFWASQRSLPQPAQCAAQMSVDADWTSACVEAKQRLALSDYRRHHEPIYKAGWNAP